MRIGVLGGTFDPIHMGHLVMAEEARVRLGLGRVLFVPAGAPWMKKGEAVSTAEHRLAMVERAIASNPGFQTSRLELDRPGDTYTVDTLRQLREEYGPQVELYFILGVDALASFARWKEPARILELCRLVVVTRPSHKKGDGRILEGISPGAEGRAVWIQEPQIGISSTEVRARVAQGLSIKYLVPQAVEEYIYGHGLYRDARAPSGD